MAHKSFAGKLHKFSAGPNKHRRKPPNPSDDPSDGSSDEDDSFSDVDDDDDAEPHRPTPPGRSKAASPQDRWRQAGKCDRITLEDVPDAIGFPNWRPSTERKVASSSTVPNEALKWIREAFDPRMPGEHLKSSGRFERIDMVLGVGSNH